MVAGALTAMCALTNMGLFHQKACKKQRKVGKNMAKCPIFKNNYVKDKKCKVSAFKPPSSTWE